MQKRMRKPLSWNEIRDRATSFVTEWRGVSSEQGEAQTFWNDFLSIFGMDRKRVATFEHNVKKASGKAGRIDLFWEGMLIAEHKSLGKDLDSAFTQATDYFPGLSDAELPRFVIVSDFARIRVRNMETGEEVEIALEDLPKNLSLFAFIAGYEARPFRHQDPVNIEAAELLAQLHDTLLEVGYEGHQLEVYLVRILFCLFADDTGIFMPRSAFEDFIRSRTNEDGSDLGPRLNQLFQTLNTPPEKRPKNLDEVVALFPYINGKLFEEHLHQASFDSAMRDSLLACCELDWGAISPAIFGSLFQGIMDATVRRNLGAHYTSEQNILKVINPLFMDDLRADFERVKKQPAKLKAFHQKLGQLQFFDPACGCGNFLVISYRELRLLELEVIKRLHAKDLQQLSLDAVDQYVKVDVDQFHGIEIEEWPAQIARVAMWLIDHQMNLLVGQAFGQALVRIPLVKSANIVHANALQMDWNDVVPAAHCSFLFGNPPFLGKQHQSAKQKADMATVTGSAKRTKELDFVCAWYIKAAGFITPGTRCAFVSTNSIAQGEQVGLLWSLLKPHGIVIHYAHRTFRWSSEARGAAAVHCVIIGFGKTAHPVPLIFEYDEVGGAAHPVVAAKINPYLIDGPDVWLESRRAPLCQVPEICFGSMANDGGHLLLDDGEKAALLAEEPEARGLVRPFVGAREFLHGTPRWCIWLADSPPGVLKSLPLVRARVKAVKKYREASPREATKRLAETPGRFGEVRQPVGRYLLVPRHSSERRAYIPIGFMSAHVIAGDANLVIPNARPFHFGVVSSAMHMAWVRYVCGRIKSDFRYTAEIVYNNYPWPVGASDKQRSAIESAVDAVLKARGEYPECSLSELYDPLEMPKGLLKAHQALDRAVDAAYVGMGGRRTWSSEAERVAFLLGLYSQLATPVEHKAAAKQGGTSRGRKKRLAPS